MNKEQFLRELEQLLKDVPMQEREAALTYYREYFEDAGEENEAVVLKELGSPERIAGIIISDVAFKKKEEQELKTENSQESVKENTANVSGMYNNTVYQNSVYAEQPKKKSNKTLWIVLGCVLGGLALVIGLFIWVISEFVGRGTAFVSGIVSETVSLVEWDTTLEECGEFSEIQCSVGAGEIFIYQSEDEKLEVIGESVGADFEPYVQDGVFYLEDEEGIHLFNDNSKIKVYLPKQEYQDMVIKLGAGSGYVEDLTAEDVSIDVGAGEMIVNGLTVSENLTLKIGAGEANVSNVSAKNIEIDCGIGEANVSGEILGDGDIDCGVGEVNLDLKDDLMTHNYDVTCELGEVTVGKERISMGGRYIDNGAEHKIKAKCGVGEINIE